MEKELEAEPEVREPSSGSEGVRIDLPLRHEPAREAVAQSPASPCRS